MAWPKRLKLLALKLIPLRISGGVRTSFVGWRRVAPLNTTLSLLTGAPLSQFAVVLHLLSVPPPVHVLVPATALVARHNPAVAKSGSRNGCDIERPRANGAMGFLRFCVRDNAVRPWAWVF